MITRIAIVGVPVSDQQQAVDFFVDTLGFVKRADEPMGPGARWIEVVPAGQLSGPALVPYTWMDAEQQMGTYTRVALETDDIDTLYAELTAKDVAFDGEPFGDESGRRFATMRDPFGNSYILSQARSG